MTSITVVSRREVVISSKMSVDNSELIVKGNKALLDSSEVVVSSCEVVLNSSKVASYGNIPPAPRQASSPQYSGRGRRKTDFSKTSLCALSTDSRVASFAATKE